MPTVLRIGGFRFYLYGHESNEPPHVHVDRGDATIKVWLEPESREDPRLSGSRDQ